MMRLRSFGEREGARDLRLDGALCPQVQELIGPLALATDLTPHMAEVDAEDALVRIHQRQRVEMKPGDAGKRSQHSEQAAFLAAHGRGNTEYAKPSCRCENAISFLPRLATDGVENELDAAA